jgi:DNA-binding beta-propeller fold protein YncE
MIKHIRVFVASLTLLVAIGAVASVAVAGDSDGHGKRVKGTFWVANRGANTIRAFDAASGDVLTTIPMAPNSQPGDLTYARGKLYVSEEFGTPPAVAIVDATTGVVLKRILTGPRPHHMHVTRDGDLVSYGVFGTNRIGIIDTRTDTLLGEWQASANPAARSHAGVFSPDGDTVYVANDVGNELAALDPRTGTVRWTMAVPAAHELILSRDGETAYVTCRAVSELRVIDLEHQTVEATIPLGPLPDTLQLSRNGKQLTVGLRGTPAQLAIVDTRTLTFQTVTTAGAGTIAGHQWTSPDGQVTYAAYEGPGAGVAIIDHRQGNAVVRILDYPGRPHGLIFVRAHENDDADDDGDDGDDD